MRECDAFFPLHLRHGVARALAASRVGLCPTMCVAHTLHRVEGCEACPGMFANRARAARTWTRWRTTGICT